MLQDRPSWKNLVVSKLFVFLDFHKEQSVEGIIEREGGRVDSPVLRSVVSACGGRAGSPSPCDASIRRPKICRPLRITPAAPSIFYTWCFYLLPRSLRRRTGEARRGKIYTPIMSRSLHRGRRVPESSRKKHLLQYQSKDRTPCVAPRILSNSHQPLLFFSSAMATAQCQVSVYL